MDRKRKKYITLIIGIFLILAGLGGLAESFFFALILIFVGFILVKNSKGDNDKSDIKEQNEDKYSPPQRAAPKKKYDYTRARKLSEDITVLDFETTGFNPIDNEIIQVGAIKYKNGVEVDRFERYAKPSSPISSKITQITGITDETVKDSPHIKDTLMELNLFLKDETIVAHNASFDMNFLLENLNRYNIEHDRFRVIDTLKLARKYIHETPNHKLPTLKQYLKIEANSHDAIEDCIVTGKLYYYCKEIQESKEI